MNTMTIRVINACFYENRYILLKVCFVFLIFEN